MVALAWLSLWTGPLSSAGPAIFINARVADRSRQENDFPDFARHAASRRRINYRLAFPFLRRLGSVEQRPSTPTATLPPNDICSLPPPTLPLITALVTVNCPN